MVNRAFDISENMFHCILVNSSGIVHKLTNLINGKSNVRSHPCEILESTDCAAVFRRIKKRISIHLIESPVRNMI